MNIPTTTVFLDIETGGLRDADRPWEIAAVVDRPENQPMELHSRHLWHLADFRPCDADPKALEMSGFYERHPLWTADEAVKVGLSDHGMTGDDLSVPVHHAVGVEALVVTKLEPLVRGALIVCCNPTYDVPKLTAMFARHGYAWTGFYRAICATTYAAGVAGLDPAGSNSEIGAAPGVDREAHGVAHGALADALYARDLYLAARERAQALHD